MTRQLAKERNIPLIDIAMLWSEELRQGQFDDFVHFTPNGHDKIAKIIAKELKGKLK